ncbi:MAG: hypothetical protein KDD44_03925 [Bdellovibrionales bacterium]|nr:hypothetical protein [Bdellovibrionales bacterium]
MFAKEERRKRRSRLMQNLNRLAGIAKDLGLEEEFANAKSPQDISRLDELGLIFGATSDDQLYDGIPLLVWIQILILLWPYIFGELE